MKNKKVGSIFLAGFLSLNLIGLNHLNANAVNNEFTISKVNSFGGNNADIFTSAIDTEDGGFITVGNTNSTNIEGITNNGAKDALIVKYDSNNNQQWAKSFGGSDIDIFNSVVETLDGGFLAVGYTKSTNIDGITNKGNYDAIIVKYSQDGNQQWAKNFGGAGIDEFNSIVNLSDGSFIAVGNSKSTNIEGITNKGDNDITIVKYSQDGTQQWVKNFGGSKYDYAKSVKETKDGGFVVVGYSSSTDIDNIVNNGEYDGVIIKYDSNGTQQWAKNFGGKNTDYVKSVVETKDGGFIVIGHNNSTDIEGITDKGMYDAIIVKYDSSGNQQWVKNFGGSEWDEFNSIIGTKDRGFIVVGYSMSTDIDSITNKGDYDAIIAKYDQYGTQQWVKNFGGTDRDKFNSIVETKNGDFIAIGESMSTDIEGITNKGDNEGFIVQYNGVINALVDPLTLSKDLNIQVVADNTLEMALSTNQISFTGYNGTSDLVNNDLNITVSSGLNYDLFATLNDELRGTNDITAIIDKSNLKIKTLTDTEYKEFTTIGTPITLVENASNGKNNVHNINFKLLGDSSVKADTYNTSITFETVQK